MKLFKNEKGMTLVEISVGFLLMSVAMIMSLSILMFSNKMFVRSANSNLRKMTTDEMYSFVDNELKYATHMRVFASGAPSFSGGYEKAITVDGNGKLMLGTKSGTNYKWKPAFAENMYDVGTLEMVTQVQSMQRQGVGNCNYGLSMSLTMDDGDVAYENAAALRMVSMAQLIKEADIQIQSSTSELTNPVITYGFGEVNYVAAEDKGFGPYTVEDRYDPIELGKEIKDFVAKDATGWVTIKEGEFYYDEDGNVYMVSFSKDLPESGWTGAAEGNAPGKTWHWWEKIDDDFMKNSGFFRKFDVVQYEKNYYMGKTDHTETTFFPDNPSAWAYFKPVFWFANQQKLKAEDGTDWREGRLCGWSNNVYNDASNPDGTPAYPNNNYVCAVCGRLDGTHDMSQHIGGYEWEMKH